MRRTLVVLFAAVHVGVAQGPNQDASARVDFRALAEDGRAVTDLKSGDLSLKVNGKARQVRALTLVQATAAEHASGLQLPPPYATNATATGGRTFYLLIDDESIAPGREAPLREAVHALVTELAPGDRLGVLTPQGQVNVRPGDDSRKVQLLIDTLPGRGSASESDVDAACRTTRALAALGSMLHTLNGAAATIAVFSAGMSPPSQNVVSVGSRGANGRTAECQVRPEDFDELGALTSLAHADMYLFHLTDAMVNRSSKQDAGFESLAGATGAEFARLSGNAQPAVARMLRETNAHYIATFDTDDSDRTGQPLRVELKTTRDGVKLRTHPTVTIPKSLAKAAPAPKDMLRVQTQYRDLPLRATAYTSRMPNSAEVKVLAVFESLAQPTALASASVGLFDAKNTLRKQWTAQPADLAKPIVMAALSAPPDSYRMRVAAVDASGRAGTVDYELTAELARADPLRLSTLVIGTQSGSGFAPRMEFTNEPVAIGYLELYGVPKAGNVKVDLDVVQTPDGAPLASAETSVRPGNTEDTRVAIGGFGIENLPAGDYLMRAIVTLDGKAVGRAVRTLRKK